MPGVDPQVILHSLNINPASRSVVQKKRNFGTRAAAGHRRGGSETPESTVHSRGEVPRMGGQCGHG
ncbi:hypothetical protein KSP39_PZI006371 [Platanthera zijinensis]|uniref:Uncharacterized protein n=1 Tax=Platanthera zijinensis TaxID=2320716 RepID=A0AAP0G9T0_9ASPA